MTDTAAQAHDTHSTHGAHPADAHPHDAHPAPGVPTTIRDEAANTPSWVPWVGIGFLVAFLGLIAWLSMNHPPVDAAAPTVEIQAQPTPTSAPAAH
ncbi:MAG: hypothetical protein IPK60_05610 [Sandaracinaceae bacterium]|nr:hypothetical protein [Sandaracinaceae bacterium]